MKRDKPVFFTSSNHVCVDDSGNKLIYKAARINGDSVILQFVVRSDRDIQSSRHPSYRLLVP